MTDESRRPSIAMLMEIQRIREITRFPTDGGPNPKYRLRFDSAADARTFRRNVECGGRVIGCFLYPAEWSPSDIQRVHRSA